MYVHCKDQREESGVLFCHDPHGYLEVETLKALGDCCFGSAGFPVNSQALPISAQSAGVIGLLSLAQLCMWILGINSNSDLHVYRALSYPVSHMPSP